MALFTILNVSAAAFYLILTFIALSMKVRGRQHILLSLTSLSLFQWTATAYFVYNTSSLQMLQWLLPISCIGMFFFFPLNLHFVYFVTHKKRLAKSFAFCLYSIALFFSILNVWYPISIKAAAGPQGSIVLVQATDNPINYIWMTYALSSWLASILFYIRYRKSSILNREKHQAELLVWMSILTTVLVMSEYYITPHIPGWNLPSQSPILFLPWIGAMVFAIWRFGFLRISPGLLTDKILDSIEDLVLLYDMRGRAVYMNRKASGTLDTHRLTDAGHGRLFEETVQPMLQDLNSWSGEQEEKQFTLRVAAPALSVHNSAAGPLQSAEEEKAGTNHHVTINFRIKPLRDRYSDPLGVLVLGTVAPRFSDILKTYRLTKREIEVVEFLMAGWTINRTARSLRISERTVKAHITNIYGKTGAVNRVELANMLVSLR